MAKKYFNRKKIKYFFTALIFFISGCKACEKNYVEDVNRNLKNKPEPAKNFSVSLKEIQNNFSNFEFESEVEINFQNDLQEKIEREIIFVKGNEKKLELTKKIDGHHFFQLISDGDNFFVKNREGKFRQVNSNKNFHRKLIHDGLNALSWADSQFNLKDKIKSKTKNRIEIIFLVSSSELESTSFVKKILEHEKAFASLRDQEILGKIFLDQETSLPIRSEINIKFTSRENPQLSISIKIKTNLKKSEQPIRISMPKPSKPSDQNYPVNIRSRFEELFNDGKENESPNES